MVINTEYEVIMNGVHRSTNSLVGNPNGEADYNPRDLVKIGDIVRINQLDYRVEKAIRPANCKGCDFRTENGACDKGKSHPKCSGYCRPDGTWIIFKCIEQERYKKIVSKANKEGYNLPSPKGNPRF